MKTQLKKDEQVVLKTKPHWLTLALPFLLTLICSVLGFIIGSYGLIIVLVFVLYFLYKVVERNSNLWIVTNLRVIDEFGVFSNNTKESPLDKINNVSYSQTFIGKILGYGNVQIQTAAEIGSTTYFSVEHPRKLKDTITRMQEEYKHYQITRQANEFANAVKTGQESNKTNVAEEIEKLFELKQKGIITEDEYKNRKAKLLNS